MRQLKFWPIAAESVRVVAQNAQAAQGHLKSEGSNEDVIQSPGTNLYKDAEELMEEIVDSVPRSDNLRPKIVRMSRLLDQIIADKGH